MSRKLLFFLLATSPVLIFMSAWQVHLFQVSEREVFQMLDRQRELLEESKRRIVGVEYLLSPARLDKIAREELGLKKIEPDAVVRTSNRKDRGIGDDG